MDTEAMHHISKTEKRAGLRWPQIAIIIFVTIAATAGLTYWLLDHYLFVKKFEPVELRPMEEQALNSKLRVIGIDVPQAGTDGPPLEPEPYSEAGARREIAFTEREVNAMVARNTDLAQKLAIDLSDDLVSATMLVPMDKDFPMLGGKTVRVTAGVKLAYEHHRPVVVLKGISVMGVPVPNAWLGNMKHVDLVKEFGTEQGFWKAFADGVDDIHVDNGRLVVKLRE